MGERKWIKVRFMIWTIRVLIKIARQLKVSDPCSIEEQGEMIIKDIEKEYNNGGKIYVTVTGRKN